MRKLVYKTELTQDCTKFISNSGNGTAVPQYELDNQNKVVPVINKETGQQVVHNLTADIQKNKFANDYKKFLENGQETIIPTGNGGSFIDTTQLGSGVDLLKADAVAKARGFKDFNDIMVKFQEFIQKQAVEKMKNEKMSNTNNNVNNNSVGNNNSNTSKEVK